MPPKHHKKQKEDIKKEKLQAVVLTDSFETRFMPLTAVTPRCLLPLANVPLIEYTLEFLANAGVDEVFLMCSGTHSEQIQGYVRDSKWALPWSPFKVRCIVSQEARSVGDVMRDLDTKQVITEDFLLISGDVVANLDIERAIRHHRKIRETDKDHIVTMIMTEASATHRTRSYTDEPAVFILNEANNKCLYYESIPAVTSAAAAAAASSGSASFRKQRLLRREHRELASISIDPELLENVDDFVLRNDLIDCHIDLCSPIVPAIYQENFDFQHSRRDFLKGILTFDLLKRSIYVYVTSDYGARAANMDTYRSISKDLVQRYIYPIVPELNFLEHQAYLCESNHIYKDAKIVLAQSCKILSNTVIGHDSFINDHSVVSHSVVGNNVIIGNNVEVRNSVVLDNVIIRDGARVVDSIVGFHVEIRDGARVLGGSVVGSNCVLDNGVVVDSVKVIDQKIEKQSDGFFSSDEEEEAGSSEAGSSQEHSEEAPIRDAAIVGANGVGFLFDEDEDADDVSDVVSTDDASSQHSGSLLYKLSELALSDASFSSVDSDDEVASTRRQARHGHRRHDSSSLLVGKKQLHRRHLSASQMSLNDEANIDSSANPEKRRLRDEQEFDIEATATLVRAIENNHDLDTAVLELNTLRMSMNVTYARVRRATMRTLAGKIQSYVETNTLKLAEATAKIMSQWGVLFKRQVFELEDAEDLLAVLQETAERYAEGAVNGKQLQFLVMKALYDEEIVEEDVIMKWYEAHREAIDNRYVDQFVEWLKSAEEESSEEESEDDDDDDE